MPSFLRDVRVHNVVVDDAALQELNRVFEERVALHNNTIPPDDERRLTQWYVVRFDDRGYRSMTPEEAWRHYTEAHSVERVVLSATSRLLLRSNEMVGEKIEIRLDSDRNGPSHIIVGGEDRDWVEGTFAALESVLRRRRSTATALIRSSWMVLLLQLTGVALGLLLALWLATLTAPFFKGVEYPRALGFALWFLLYGNLWGYLQQQALLGLDSLFPNVRLARSGDHWIHAVLRESMKAAVVAVLLYAFTVLTKWASALIGPLLTGAA